MKRGGGCVYHLEKVEVGIDVITRDRGRSSSLLADAAEGGEVTEHETQFDDGEDHHEHHWQGQRRLDQNRTPLGSPRSKTTPTFRVMHAHPTGGMKIVVVVGIVVVVVGGIVVVVVVVEVGGAVVVVVGATVVDGELVDVPPAVAVVEGGTVEEVVVVAIVVVVVVGVVVVVVTGTVVVVVTMVEAVLGGMVVVVVVVVLGSQTCSRPTSSAVLLW